MTLRTKVLRLSSGHGELTVYPELGGAIGSWSWGGNPILYSRPGHADVGDMASFPMVPYANRIAHGRLSDRIVLPAHPGELHSLHGIGWKRAWEVLDVSGSSAHLALRHQADRDWPFDFLAESSIALTPDRMTQTLSLHNTGGVAMPAGLGLHPYFPVDERTTLHTNWDGAWGVSDDHLPTVHVPQACAPVVGVHGWQVNNCFTGWSRTAVLVYDRYSVEIGASAACAFVQCYRPGHDAGFVAIEPVTHIPNAHQLEVEGVRGTGLRWLAPGESMKIVMTLQARAHGAESSAGYTIST